RRRRARLHGRPARQPEPERPGRARDGRGRRGHVARLPAAMASPREGDPPRRSLVRAPRAVSEGRAGGADERIGDREQVPRSRHGRRDGEGGRGDHPRGSCSRSQPEPGRVARYHRERPQNLNRSVGLIGYGSSTYEKGASRPEFAFLAEAGTEALASAGLAKAEIDGLATSSTTLGPDNAVTTAEYRGLTLSWAYVSTAGG